ncbi:hypothetical protein BTHERMOSOX_1253 [Bathymodiolus thermophilus thioautotrophic gill symbiont]|uniref:Uncharacterized protein n=1 Tax=Bathymodiolus thermophilus thioautotrophic gill symbiont TaxID=2360 RepID=A0A3G3IPS1_9GAMM|nr:hypothetical protein [Bathymodiolus thermophilus thioautotrophic gill symbiont]AYQ57811.1 hypothetical protein MS2017_2160 [Bathymodiolus thermophilus thioautotrophic gill symbiont]CAB5494981.1 hypothetical protein THERMOT_214 [Bathymodiolus thermophilus thioautotrophic gill symbiont]CAB5495309.1 hypothetical protein THERMOS_278 [Bathymodiolus thermophilus thioautotrophic gill symbiont]SHA07023.1 hypothetical protein BTHERMOSOX_1253 [Bathymodiolus thermophilus thioautotrophic gill symbiont]
MGFKYLNKEQDIFDGDDGEDVYANEEQLQARLAYFEAQLAGLSENAPTEDRIKNLLEIGRIQVERYKGADAWEKAFTAFTLAQDDELWELAVEACDVMFLSEGPDALVALGHALWLGITFPIDPEITVAMLQHLVEESPEEADTRAVAATVAHYITSMRCGEEDDLTFFTSQMLASVADKHSHVTDQSTFDLWRRTLELDKPDVFLKKLSGAIDQLVEGKWWIDKDKIRTKLDNENQN